MSARQPHDLLAAAESNITIYGVALSPIEYEGARVMTLAMIDQVHQRPDGTAGRTFRDNRDRLIVGDDYFELDQPDAIRRLGFSRPQGGTPAKVLLITETGYSMLVKTFSDDLAWQVQRQLVKSYFSKAAPASAPPPRPLDIATQALKLAPLAMRAARAFGLDINAAAISANQYVCAVTGQNLLKAFGQTHLEAENQGAKYFTPTNLGKRIGLNGRKFNDRLAAAGFQAKQGGEWELTATGRAFGRIFDTGKNHDSGVPVQQIKWAANVIDALPPILGGGQASLI